MIYLTRMLGRPVVDAAGERIGTISDIAIATGEIFPRVTALAFSGPDKTPFMLSWRKYVADLGEDAVTLKEARPVLRFSYLQPDEVLLARDLLNKQIVDTQGMQVVRVNDLKLSESKHQLRLLGAEVGVRGILRGISPALETAVDRTARILGTRLPEKLIAWNYMDLLDRDLSHVHLSVTHKRLHELHPADVADILEQLSAGQRARVFEHLDNAQAAETISEMEDEFQADVIEDLSNQRASDILEMMDPDDAADVIGDLPYDKKETLLRLMGVNEAREIRKLLGYKENTAGGIMTPEITTVTEEMTAAEVIEHIRGEAAENENIYYIYVVDDDDTLVGVVSLRQLIMAQPETRVADILERDVISVDVETDQEDVAEQMSKYDLLAMPVIDETGKIVGMVTVDDALDVMEEESAEDLALATGRRTRDGITGIWQWVSRDGWMAWWAILFALAAIVGHAVPLISQPLIVGLLLAVIVMRIAEDVASHTMARIIDAEDDEDRPSFLRRLANDSAAGLVLGLVVGLATFGVLEIYGQTPAMARYLFQNALLPYEFWVPFALGFAVLAVTVAGSFVGNLAEGRVKKGRTVTQPPITAVLTLVGVVVFLGVLAAAVSTSPALTRFPLG